MDFCHGSLRRIVATALSSDVIIACVLKRSRRIKLLFVKMSKQHICGGQKVRLFWYLNFIFFWLNALLPIFVGPPYATWLSSGCHRCTVAKRCKIEPRLLLITNRKSHTGFQMTLTLDDFEGRYADFLTEIWLYLRNGERCGQGYYESLKRSDMRSFK